MKSFLKNGRRALFIFWALIFFAAAIVEAEADRGRKKSPAIPQKNEARVEGFRSARFGMSEKEVLKSIYKDFRITRKHIERQVHPLEKTVNLGITVQDLLPETGLSKAYYVFGYKSHRLIQVNVVWGKPVEAKPNAEGVVNLANQLREYFAGQDFLAEGRVTNAPVGKDAIMVFRGKDKLGRMVILLLNNPMNTEGLPNQDIVLQLSYIQKPENPDVFRIDKGKF